MQFLYTAEEFVPLLEYLYVMTILIQNSLAVKKVCGPKNAVVKKDEKSKVVAKKWL